MSPKHHMAQPQPGICSLGSGKSVSAVPGTSPKRLHKGSSVQWLLEEGFSRQAPACLEKGWGSAVRGNDCPAPRITPTALALHSLWERSVQPPHSQCTTGGCFFAESAQMAKGLIRSPKSVEDTGRQAGGILGSCLSEHGPG